ncbi:MAG: hypothetical protein OI715_00130 (plasmid) [Candidatus Methanoperedens sp.]|nr:MAG: hypothetical protein OI715_00130 [Candidatus Methanoperedens sp.]
MINDKGSITIEAVFDSLLRLGLVMQLVVLTVSIMITILISFLINIGFGAVITAVFGPLGTTAVVASALIGGTNDAQMTNATQDWVQGAMKWKP